LPLRIALLVLLCALALPGTAWAHARPLSSTPRDGVVLSDAPERVRVVFDDDVRVASGTKAVRNGGRSVLADAGRPAAAGPRRR
jgi:methionine-rich copper-binding protein CopC